VGAERTAVDDDEGATRLDIARVILRAGTLVAGCALVGSVILRPMPVTGHVSYLAMLAVNGGAWLAVRRGASTPALVGFVALFLAVVLANVYTDGGVRSPGMFVLAPLVLFAGLTLHTIAAIAVATVGAAATLALVAIERRGDLPVHAPLASSRFWLVAMLSLAMVVFMLVVAIRAIHRARAAAAASRRARDELEARLLQARRLESIGRLAAGVAHDFNNVLTVVFAEASRLARADEPRAKAAAGSIQEAAERAAALTRQLLTFGRRQASEPEVLDVSAVVRRLERLLARFVGGDIRLEVRLADGLPALRADRIEVEQILLNLVTNARDAMPEGGVVTIETAIAPAALREQAEVAAGDAVLVRVRDTGAGIAPEVRARLFEPFFTTKAIGKGTGLGLATVRDIVTRLGGGVVVDSVPGAGATFTVVLPATDARAVAAAAAARPVSRAGTRILIVDDDALVRAALEALLRDQGFEVETARAAADVLRAADAWPRPPELVLADVVMPDTGGVALVRTLRARYPALRVLLMSGYTDERVTGSGALADGVHFLAKPFEQGALLDTIEAVLADAPARSA
jgi:signal transduction histidine kinase/ActR/RegA family two-component response regulator